MKFRGGNLVRCLGREEFEYSYGFWRIGKEWFYIEEVVEGEGENRIVYIRGLYIKMGYYMNLYCF